MFIKHGGRESDPELADCNFHKDRLCGFFFHRKFYPDFQNEKLLLIAVNECLQMRCIQNELQQRRQKQTEALRVTERKGEG